jgi:hypothetical protein
LFGSIYSTSSLKKGSGVVIKKNQSVITISFVQSLFLKVFSHSFTFPGIIQGYKICKNTISLNWFVIPEFVLLGLFYATTFQP